jgi:IS5 family transposase
MGVHEAFSLGMLFKMAPLPLARRRCHQDNVRVRMKQADFGLDLTSRETRRGKFLDEMDRVVPWA